MTDYLGYVTLNLSDEELADYFSGLYEFPDLINNQYGIIYNNGEVAAKFCYQKDAIKQVRFPVITTSRNTISPRNEYQACAIDLLLSRDVPVKLLTGRGGAGKDLLMANAALSLLEKGKFKKIVYIRPNVTVADVPDIGYLKGDTFSKLEWTLGPLFDKYGSKEDLLRIIKNGSLELVPLIHIRGRSFENSIVYVTEAQNLTSSVMELLVTRIGEGSELWINGDCAQTDRKVFSADNGIRALQEAVSGREEFGQVYLPLIERSRVAKLGDLFHHNNDDASESKGENL